jgi:hypothetical protein
MIAPSVLLVLFCVVFGMITGSSTADQLDDRVQLVPRWALALAVALWVLSDARKRRLPLCYDYDAFLFFAWPLVLPIYLVQTRGWRAIFAMLGFASLYLLWILSDYLTQSFHIWQYDRSSL